MSFQQKPFFSKKVITSPEVLRQIQEKTQGVALTETLKRAGYYREGDLTLEELQAAQAYFDFNVLSGQLRFRRFQLTGFTDNQLASCDLPGLNKNLIEIKRFLLPPISCRACELINECRQPVHPSWGRYNIMIVGEAPGRWEDEWGYGFAGDAGNVLWKELLKYGLDSLMFHVTNVCKCWPSKTKTPTPLHIASCNYILETEIKVLNPVMILALGKTTVQAFRNGEGKITDLNGTTEWSDKHQCWISYCIHPASVLYQSSNREKFEAGVENFVSKLKLLGGLSWAVWKGISSSKECPYGGTFPDDNGKYVSCETCKIWENCAAAKIKTDWNRL